MSGTGIAEATPTIQASTTSITNFGSVVVNTASTAQSFTVSGSNLTGNITLTAPTNFEISKSSGSGYASSLSYTPSGGTVSTSTVYVRFRPTSTGSKTGSISITSSGATTRNVSLSGTGIICTPPVSPTGITASRTIINSGQSVTLQVNEGTLNSATEWAWFTGNCGGLRIGIGTTITEAPTQTTSYFVQASACGTTTVCRSVTVNVLPPFAAFAATGVAQTGFTGNWSREASSNGYCLDIAYDESFTNKVSGFNCKDVGDELKFTVTGLNPNTTYYYRVTGYYNSASSGGGSGPGGAPSYGSPSNPIKVTTLQAPSPSAPVAIAATSLSAGSFTANWSTTANATRYFIDISTNSNFTSFVAGYNNKDVGAVTSFEITGLNNNTTYYYRVRSSNSGGTSPNSNVITITTGTTSPMADFAGSVITGCAPLTVTFTDNSTNKPSEWEWDIDNDGNTDYRVQNPIHTYNEPGTYSVKLTVSNSSGSNQKLLSGYIVVNSTLKPEVGITSNQQIICAGQVASFSANPKNGGSSATFVWKNNGVVLGTGQNFSTNNLKDGDKLVCEMASGLPCVNPSIIVSDVYTVSVNPKVGNASAIVVSNGSNPSCVGQTVTYSIGNIPEADYYIWTLPGGAITTTTSSSISIYNANVVSSGVLKVKGFNNCGEGAERSLTINVNHTPVPPIIGEANGILVSTSPQGNQWYYYDTPIENANNNLYTPTRTGLYSATVMVNNCISQKSNVLNFINTSIQGNFESAKIELFPNPTTGVCEVRIGNQFKSDFVVNIFNENGALVQKLVKNKFDQNFEIDLSKNPTGIYLIQILSDEALYHTKIIKRDEK